MLYQAYQLQDDLVAPMRFLARGMRALARAAFWAPATA